MPEDRSKSTGESQPPGRKPCAADSVDPAAEVNRSACPDGANKAVEVNQGAHSDEVDWANEGSWPARRRVRFVGYAAVFVAALAARLAMVLNSSGGLTGTVHSYDANVYYAADAALTFGRMPYRDFVLVHPPGSTIELAPFALLGRVTTDHTGFLAANLAVMVLGAVNAVLVAVIVRRLGARTGPALLGGAFYAVWFVAVSSEAQIRLGPRGNFWLLCGLWAFAAARGEHARRNTVLAGFAFGAAATVKIWWAAPVVIFLLWHLVPSRRKQLLPAIAGAAATLIAVNAPFFVAAPAAMWYLVVTDQLGRHRNPVPVAGRVRGMLGVDRTFAGLPPAPAHILVLVSAAVGPVILIAAWRNRAARPAVTILGCQVFILAVSPPWFGFYRDFLAPAAAIVVGIGASAAIYRHRALDRVSRSLPVLAVLASIIATVRISVAGTSVVLPFPATRLQPAARGVTCLMSDSPAGPIMLDTLSRDLAAGCPNWIDVTGRSIGVAGQTSNGQRVSLPTNPRWQQLEMAYLRSGGAVILMRGHKSGLSAASVRLLRRGGLLARSGKYVIYRITHNRQRRPRGAGMVYRSGSG